MFRYAQLNDDGRVVGLSNLSGEIDYPDMIEITEDQQVSMGDIYDPETKSFSRPKEEDKPTEETKKIASIDEIYSEVERISKTQAATMLAIADIFEVIVSAQDGNLDTGESNSTTGTEDGSEEERPLSPEEMELLASMGGDLPNIPTPETEEKP